MNRLTPSLALACALIWTGTAGAAPERTGKAVYETVCASCHKDGRNGAPRFGDQQAWAQRAAKGLDKLTANAITGVRNMPAHGGQANLSDLEMSRGVAYLVSGGKAVDPDKVYSSPVSRTGEQIVAERCQECHSDGRSGAPRLGDMAAWQPRLKKGVDPLVKSAIQGHKGMPARGGMADLSDAEMKRAVEHMIARLGGAKP